MVGSLPYEENGDKMWQKLLKHYSDETNISIKSEVSEGTTVAPRYDENYMYYVVINMDGLGGAIELNNDSYDVLNKCKVLKGTINVGKYEYKILKINYHDHNRNNILPKSNDITI